MEGLTGSGLHCTYCLQVRPSDTTYRQLSPDLQTAKLCIPHFDLLQLRCCTACRAAMFAEHDQMNGVSENIMLGQLAPMGTGSFELWLNEGGLKDAVEVSHPAAACVSICYVPVCHPLAIFCVTLAFAEVIVSVVLPCQTTGPFFSIVSNSMALLRAEHSCCLHART